MWSKQKFSDQSSVSTDSKIKDEDNIKRYTLILNKLIITVLGHFPKIFDRV